MTDISDQCFNIFLFVSGNFIESIGVVVHHIQASDEERCARLQSLVNTDCHSAKRFPITPLPVARYQAMMREGSHLSIFDHVFNAVKAPPDPLRVITFIVNDQPRILAITGLGPLNLSEINIAGANDISIDDYLKTYRTEGLLDLPRLLNDDYFIAIKLLFNEFKYVSASKLIVSFIDTVGFVEYGRVDRSFQMWLETYANLARIGVSSDELWEYRNSLLHMTNLESRKVMAGKIAALSPFVGPEFPHVVEKGLNIWVLIHVVAAAMEKWISTYNEIPGKILSFIERYDLVISDARVAAIVIANPEIMPFEAN